ncbi:carbon storage regulator CsrA [Anaerosolibacter sp.]|uniref:carbon storage regulator CsrA n=1 Tax=Anaerosolibacter sp. TaxID=1872527 RepID=UPI0039EE1F90
MLVLSRKKDESIMINGNIEIKVIAVEDGKVKLGISAPKEIDIHRKEVYLEIQDENKEAAKGSLQINNLTKLFKK